MKKLFPIVLILCAVGAWASIITKNINTPKQYEEYLQSADAAYEKEYYYEAIQWTNEAVKVEGIDSVYEAEAVKRDSYYNLEEWDSFESQCLSMIKKYPEQVENYELILQYYMDNEMLRDLSNKLSKYKTLWPENQVVLSAMEKMEKSYEYVKTGYCDVKYIEPTMVEIQAVTAEEVDGKLVVSKEIVGKEGKTIFDWGYSQNIMAQDFKSCFVCDQDGKWKKVNSGDYLLARNLNASFEYIGRLGTNNIATAIIDGKYYFINGEMLVSDKSWEKAGTFHDNLNAVMQGGKWGFVTTADWTGENQYLYKDIVLNSQEYCTLNGKCVVADEKGYYILETEEFSPISANVYEELKAFESLQPTAYRSGDKWGFVTGDGDIYIEAMYEDAKPYVNGYAAVKQNGLWGYINKDNEMIIEPQFQDALYVLNSGYAYVKSDSGYWDYIILHKLFYAN